MSLIEDAALTQASVETDILPKMTVLLSKKMIIMGAVSSRDWQPIHHDSEYARNNASLPDIIMNNYTQAGWLSRYVTDWAGPQARPARLKFSMRSPLCPGDEAVFSGVVENREQRAGFVWLDIAVTIYVGERLATKAAIRLALPAAEGGASPWLCSGATWCP
ncbi:MaoC/PaaZ C-terminal domain-containing protein [Dasania marina]|uniref:MaoC/PaaZ C-terminal domain-containing protein n=1 Tax=Dasania marina TaxID=471499 RepID=UPI0004B626BC|nr:MaoC/PaaZ C-terminal domain-containing protein [Dasania marina]